MARGSSNSDGPGRADDGQDTQEKMIADGISHIQAVLQSAASKPRGFHYHVAPTPTLDREFGLNGEEAIWVTVCPQEILRPAQAMRWLNDVHQIAVEGNNSDGYTAMYSDKSTKRPKQVRVIFVAHKAYESLRPAVASV